MSICYNEVVKLVLFVIKLLLERAGRASEFLIQGHGQMQIMFPIEILFSLFHERVSQFVIKKVYFHMSFILMCNQNLILLQLHDVLSVLIFLKETIQNMLEAFKCWDLGLMRKKTCEPGLIKTWRFLNESSRKSCTIASLDSIVPWNWEHMGLYAPYARFRMQTWHTTTRPGELE